MGLRWRMQQAVVAGCSKLLRSSGMFDSYYASWRDHFDAFQDRGFHLLPVHYYTPVPDTRELTPELWQKPSQMPGVRTDEEKAKALLERFAASYGGEYAQFPADAQPDRTRYYRNNPAFRVVDASILYCFVRSLKPKRIIEIGSGFSTLVIAQALTANVAEDRQYTCDFQAIEPYPPEYLKHGFAGSPNILKSRLQDVPQAMFDTLGNDDILFIDSTHVLRTGSDVQREYLEILPRVGSGVVVHIHDIFLPAEYPREWLTKMRFFWNEQYVLQAFLAFNDRFEVLWPAHLMYLKYAAALKAAFPGYLPEQIPTAESPASWWMRRL